MRGATMSRPLAEGAHMKIAVTATGKNLEDEMDQRFGRAAFFLIVDTVDNQVNVIDNAQNLQSQQGAGIQAAKTVIDQGAEVVITGHCGPNAFQALQAAGVNVVVGVRGTVEQVLDQFKRGKLETTQSSDVPGHWS